MQKKLRGKENCAIFQTNGLRRAAKDKEKNLEALERQLTDKLQELKYLYWNTLIGVQCNFFPLENFCLYILIISLVFFLTERHFSQQFFWFALYTVYGTFGFALVAPFCLVLLMFFSNCRQRHGKQSILEVSLLTNSKNWNTHLNRPYPIRPHQVFHVVWGKCFFVSLFL